MGNNRTRTDGAVGCSSSEMHIASSCANEELTVEEVVYVSEPPETEVKEDLVEVEVDPVLFEARAARVAGRLRRAPRRR